MHIVRKNTHVEVTGHIPDAIRENVLRKFSIYDKPTFSFERLIVDETDDGGLMLFGRISDSEIRNLFGISVQSNFVCDEYAEIDFSMNNAPKNIEQEHLTDFLKGELNFRYTKSQSQLLVNIDTAFGKTYCTINALQDYGTRVAIIVPTTTLVSNWRDEFIKHTDIQEDEILTITPSMFSNIISGKICLDNIKVCIIVHASITAIRNNHGNCGVTDLFATLKIGVKVFDEIHKNFRNMVLTDLYTNTNKTLYLSATVKRSDSREKVMMDRYFNGMLFFSRNDIGDFKENYIKGIIFRLKTYPTVEEKKSMITQRGGMKGLTPSMYAKYISNSRFDAISDVIDKAVPLFLAKKYKKGRMLILISNNVGQDAIYQYISEKYSDPSIKVINSKTRANDRDFDTDIIVSSTSLMGTGVNIPELTHLLMLDTYSSEITAEQIPNRLRKIKDATQIYMETYDATIPESIRQFDTRYKVLSNHLKDVLLVDMPDRPLIKDYTNTNYEFIF